MSTSSTLQASLFCLQDKRQRLIVPSFPGGGGFGKVSDKGKIVAKREEQTFFPKANGSVNAWTSAQEASN